MAFKTAGKRIVGKEPDDLENPEDAPPKRKRYYEPGHSRNQTARQTITLRSLPREYGAETVAQALKNDWKVIQARKAFDAVNAGLDCTDDPYKRANIGVQVLKGLGMYTEGQAMQVAVLFSAVPDSLAPSFVQSAPIEVNAAQSTELQNVAESAI